jgi:transposase
MGDPQKRYPPELRERAVRMVAEVRAADPEDHGVIARVARQLGVGAESLRNWVKQADVDAGTRPGLTTEERAELAALRKENHELKRSNEILRRASAYFAQAELDRPWK